jgi:hypothetical protein
MEMTAKNTEVAAALMAQVAMPEEGLATVVEAVMATEEADTAITAVEAAMVTEEVATATEEAVTAILMATHCQPKKIQISFQTGQNVATTSIQWDFNQSSFKVFTAMVSRHHPKFNQLQSAQ